TCEKCSLGAAPTAPDRRRALLLESRRTPAGGRRPVPRESVDEPAPNGGGWSGTSASTAASVHRARVGSVPPAPAEGELRRTCGADPTTSPAFLGSALVRRRLPRLTSGGWP